jgi:hypothetical protein
MQPFNGIFRRGMFASATLLLISLQGIVSCQTAAAEPAEPPTLPAPGSSAKAVVRDYLATIAVSVGPKNKPKRVLCSYILPVPAGREDFGLECDRSYRIEVLIQTDPKRSPVEHSAQMIIIGLGNRVPKGLTVPRLTFADGQSCLVRTPVEHGDELEVKVSVSQPKPAG